jgi:broad specificity phosphatase PhoE
MLCHAVLCHAVVFLARMQQLQQWIEARPERVLAVVTHWGVLRALTGRDFENCELQTVKLSELRLAAAAG